MKADQRQSRDPPAFMPSESWINALETQCTQMMIARVVSYARVRALAAGPVLSSYAEDVVQDAINDTAQGTLRWDSNGPTLEQHLRDAVKRRTSHDGKRSLRFHHHSLDASTDEGTSIREEVDDALLAQSIDPDAASAAADDVAQLRQLVADDPDVLTLIEARARGASTRRELMRSGNLSSSAYHNARRRLPKYLALLSTRVRRSRNRVA